MNSNEINTETGVSFAGRFECHVSTLVRAMRRDEHNEMSQRLEEAASLIRGLFPQVLGLKVQARPDSLVISKDKFPEGRDGMIMIGYEPNGRCMNMYMRTWTGNSGEHDRPECPNEEVYSMAQFDAALLKMLRDSVPELLRMSKVKS